MDKKLKTINPATEEVLEEYELIGKEQLNDIVKKSRDAFLEWKEDIDKRADFLYAFAKEFRKNKENLAKTATKEMGKAIKESRSEVEKCAWTAEYYADHGKIFANDEVVNTDARKSIITFQPLGVIGSIMPWNFPYWQGLRFAAPSLMVGNTIVLKPASATMQCGIEIEKTFDRAGVPHGVFQTIVGDSSSAETLIDADGINAVTFTGSVPVGAKVAQRATSQIKKTVLELGGSDPFIVCDDADIEKASTGAVKGRFINCGQSCIASKRFIVTKKVASEFIEKFVQKTEKLKVGDPLSDDTDIGPLVNAKSLENMQGIVNRTVKEGSELLIGGGERIKNKGYFFAPTILKNVLPHMEIAQEEVFGPIAPVITVDDEKEAIRIANDSKFGLGASIWTQDLVKAERLSSMVQSGIVTVNNVVVSDPRVPFGGVKNSGFGRELSRFGMLEFVNIKSVRFYDQLIYEHHVE
ncbi:MAG TPA: NAD-dependent succinate-semialdehyde dehydrogenase [Nitrososphaeraceae archaeon]|nr:NAD-dependent succinate-semialdehyde dehydrogenase [Nitrososphaeraceae archaeon]